jgi:hypothetical protein
MHKYWPPKQRLAPSSFTNCLSSSSVAGHSRSHRTLHMASFSFSLSLMHALAVSSSLPPPTILLSLYLSLLSAVSLSLSVPSPNNGLDGSSRDRKWNKNELRPNRGEKEEKEEEEGPIPLPSAAVAAVAAAAAGDRKFATSIQCRKLLFRGLPSSSAIYCSTRAISYRGSRDRHCIQVFIERAGSRCYEDKFGISNFVRKCYSLTQVQIGLFCFCLHSGHPRLQLILQTCRRKSWKDREMSFPFQGM